MAQSPHSSNQLLASLRPEKMAALLPHLKIVELPIHFAERREGESKMSLKVQLESAMMPLSLRRRAR